MEIKTPEYGYYQEGEEIKGFFIKVPEATPFWLNAIHAEYFPFPVKVIKVCDFNRRAICVRTDKIKFAWVWWSLRYRLDKTAEYFKCFVVLSLGEWGAAFTPECQEARWSDIGKKPKAEE